jgi:N-acetylglucosamine kinase-like BadF-type ATPase
MPFFLGIDGGGTKTSVVVGDETSVLGSGSSSSCKVQKVGEACARGSLTTAINEACVHAGIAPRQITQTCAGITGSARPEIAGVMRQLLASVVYGEVEIVSDFEIAFEDAFGDAPGIIVVAGTGALAYGRNAKGEAARVGGWGSVVSDEGSGYWIGVEAVRTSLRACDLGEAPGLLNTLQERLEAKTFDDFIVCLNASPAPDFASLFPVVLSSAEAGEMEPNRILERAGQELSSMAEIVVKRLFANVPCAIAMHGGVFWSSSTVRRAFSGALRARCPKTTLLHKAIDPARGALDRARKGFNPRAQG